MLSLNSRNFPSEPLTVSSMLRSALVAIRGSSQPSVTRRGCTLELLVLSRVNCSWERSVSWLALCYITGGHCGRQGHGTVSSRIYFLDRFTTSSCPVFIYDRGEEISHWILCSHCLIDSNSAAIDWKISRRMSLWPFPWIYQILWHADIGTLKALIAIVWYRHASSMEPWAFW